MADKKRGLGRGLDLLFSDNAADSSSVTELKLTEIEPNRFQPRRSFDDEALGELADSIKQHGLLQPITVRPLPNFGYQIVAGERRWRASRLAGLESVPVIIREMSDRECMELAIVENLQREDLGPVEEAKAFRSLIDSYGLTQEQVAAAVGKSRPVIANSLRLLKLPAEVLEMLESGEITSGHARAVLAIDDEEVLARAVGLLKKGATVREIEALGKVKRARAAKKAESAPTFYKEVELSLSTELGRKVRVSGSEGKGSVTIDFYSEEELAEMAKRLCGEK